MTTIPGTAPVAVALPREPPTLFRTCTWIHSQTVDLGTMPDAVPRSRDVLRAYCTARELIINEGNAVQVVSELVANAVRATLSEQQQQLRGVRLRLAHTQDGMDILMEVFDDSPKPPAPPSALDGLAESGRGLVIVSSLSELWGYYRSTYAGKAVWSIPQ